jgi:hypothetical protein
MEGMVAYVPRTASETRKTTMVDRDIEDLLRAHTVTFERLDEATWRGVIATQVGHDFRVFVKLNGPFVRAELSPFMTLPEDPTRRAALCIELLRRNRTLAEARFALDDDDDVVIETVVDRQGAPAALGAVLDALAAAAETNYFTLLKI